MCTRSTMTTYWQKIKLWIAALKRNFLKFPVIKWIYCTNFLNADQGFPNRKRTQKQPVLSLLENYQDLAS
uniref:Macaca fascicularis brain cDNA, clone: QtrA-17483 n=1 Tax=Macaca fascicularis TaxID=9541 RepID=I7GNR5_MACFA|nr:unnamed protein product [Macaca fascicularis]